MIIHNIRIALRALLRHKSYAAISLTGLGIGMASCLLILIFVTDELSYDQYHLNKHRIYRFATEVRGSSYGGIAKINGPWGPAVKDEIPEVENMTRFVMSGQLLIASETIRSYESGGFYADPATLQIFSFQLKRGDGETALVAPNSMVVTESFSRKYFGDIDPMGKVVRVDGSRDFKVTGVLTDVPGNSHFTFSYLLSMESLQHPLKDNWLQWNQFYTYLLLREGADPTVVTKKIKPILEKNLDQESADSFEPILQPLTDIHLRSHLHREMTTNSDERYLYVFSSIALLILAISCANFIGMSTAQASVRAREIGVRKINGAIRRQVAFQFLTESVMLCVAALLGAMFIAALCLPTLNDLSDKNIPITRFLEPHLIGGAICIAFATALVAGIYPSVYQSSLKPLQVLKGRWTSPGSASLRQGLVAFQFALSSLLVIASVVILRQLDFIRNKPLGFDPQQIITIPIQSNDLRSNYETVKKELLTHPGILSVSLSGTLPGGSDWGMPSIPEGFTSENAPPMRVMATDADFLNTYGIGIASGRNFSDDIASDSAAYLINEEAVRQLGWTDPLSKTISIPVIGRNPAPVIGVVRDFHFRSLHENIGPILFMVPPRTWYSVYSIKINAGQASDVLKFIEHKWTALDPEHPFTYNFFDVGYNNLYQRESRLATILGYFTTIGIFLACLGLYSLASFTAEQRTREIGVRKVVGASVSQIVFMLSKQFLMLVLAGFALAIPFAWWAGDWWLQGFAYRINLDVATVLICGFSSCVAALLTVVYRAMRAATANPVHSLRNE